MKIALAQLDIPLGKVSNNLIIIEKYIIKAHNEKADLILFPEFFTSSMGFCDVMLDVPKQNKTVPDILKKWSSEYNIIIGGSFLLFDGKNTMNQFQLVFPDGKVFIHNKDIPTQYENCYYTYGDEEHILDTPVGKIGVALCWEQIRTDTVRRLKGKVLFVLACSCWWDLPINAPVDREVLRKYNQTLAINSPVTLAKLLGVPVFHATHCGSITTMRFPNKEIEQTRNLVGATQAVDGAGNVINRRLWSEGEGLLLFDFPEDNLLKAPAINLPDSYWIPSLPDSYLNAWESFNPLGEKYYHDIALPYYKSQLM